MSALRIAIHAAILTAPLAALGRSALASRLEAVACVLAMVVLGELESAARTTTEPSGARAPGTGLALASALGLLATTWAAIGFPSLVSPTWAWCAWLGAPMIVVGAALRIAAIRALGAAFTSEIVAAPGRALVTRGIYARMRHPSDAGLLLVAFGLACLGGSIAAALVAAGIVLPSALLRIVREDRVLAAAHPDHAAYRRTVGAVGLHRSA